MKTKASIYFPFFLFTITFCLVWSVTAQTLTVPQIMGEPSIAGMRVDGEKLSPDGSKVVYLWNAEGKQPRDLYISATERPEPRVLLRVTDLPKPAATPTPENKLDYGLTVRDDFVKERENQLGGFEWSPDSKKLLFSYHGDLYVLNVDATLSSNRSADEERNWKGIESALLRRADLAPKLIEVVRSAGADEREIFAAIAETRSRLLQAIQGPTALGREKTADEKQAVLAADDAFGQAIDGLKGHLRRNPVLFKDGDVSSAFDDLRGVENRINVYASDYLRSRQGSNPKRYTKTQTAEFAARFLDIDRILYQQGGNLFVLNTSDATTVQLTKEINSQPFTAVNFAMANKAGSMVAYIVSDSSKQKALFVPNYLDEFVAAPSVRRGWTDQKVLVTPADGSPDTPFELKLPKAEGMSYFRRLVWTADGRSLIVDRNDKDTKRRQLFYIHNVGSKDEQTILITDETDDKWQAELSVIFEPNPKDPGQLFFCSERDGYNHIYLATLEAETRPVGSVPANNNARVAEGSPGPTGNVTIKQLTKGPWQVEWAKWTPDGDQIIYSSTEGNTAERDFYALSPDNGKTVDLQFSENGMSEDPQMDESNPHPTLLYSFSQWNRPQELYAVKVCSGCRGTYIRSQITKTTPEAFKTREWNRPKFVGIQTGDGKNLNAKVYLPAAFDQKKKYPMVVFVHGAGYLQNVTNGWSYYYREFMFNELLTQKGYVVLDIDYRGSAGYGRDWRTDVYDFLGGKDYDDHIDAIDYMVKNYAVNVNKIGVYGGSYGGFMAEMLAMRAPDKIAAAAALRPVADWKNYYASSPIYTAQRLGFPDKNPEAYKRSSPIAYADKLTRPLLILHGMGDDNVHVQDSEQLIEKLIRLGKTPYFEAMLYPAENHGFTRATSWTDEYGRILAFFEKHLK